MSIGRDWKFLDDAFRWHARLLEMTKHLFGCCFHRTVGRSDLYSMVFCVVRSQGPDIRGYLTIL